jgi:hypothetical protein
MYTHPDNRTSKYRSNPDHLLFRKPKATHARKKYCRKASIRSQQTVPAVPENGRPRSSVAPSISSNTGSMYFCFEPNVKLSCIVACRYTKQTDRRVSSATVLEHKLAEFRVHLFKRLRCHWYPLFSPYGMEQKRALQARLLSATCTHENIWRKHGVSAELLMP